MTCLLDTHFLVWIVSGSGRLKHYPWLQEYEPWTVSPVSFLELQLLSEVGRGRFASARFTEDVMRDSRFTVDEVSVVTLFQKSLDLGWTRDPFDRLIVAHSLARRIPLCSVDRNILDHHKQIVRELL